MVRKILYFVVIFVMFMTLAQAHRPGTLKGETTVDNPYVSWVFAGRLEKGDEVYVLKMEMERPFATPFEMLVGRSEANRDFRPQYAIVGPGLPKPDRRTEAILPRPVPDGMGVFYEAHDAEERQVFFETIMRRNYWSSGTIAIPLLKGKYEIWVWSKDQQKGSFYFSFGVEEKFDDGAFSGIFDDWGLYAY